MFRSLVHRAGQFLNDFHRAWWRNGLPTWPAPPLPAPLHTPAYERLQRVLLTDEVNRTILEEFAAHRADARGDEETGWVLLGVRDVSEATVLATLPAGAGRDAGVAHVRFDSSSQALASRIVRQWDRRLTMLGVLHTHPGNLRHPSDGDYRGDSQWVGRLRGQDGIFGIGTADAARSSHTNGNGSLTAFQPQQHMQVMGSLCLSWYGLRHGERGYRPLTVGLTLGPDLARPLRPIWSAIEAHADEMDRLCRQQSAVKFEVADAGGKACLGLLIKLAAPGESLRVLLNEEGVRYYWIRGSEVTEVDPREGRVDRGVYLILAELAS